VVQDSATFGNLVSVIVAVRRTQNISSTAEGSKKIDKLVLYKISTAQNHSNLPAGGILETKYVQLTEFTLQIAQ
jgi:hypothetical protein